MSQYNVQLQDGNGPLAGLRNQLINGNFTNWQRGTSFTVTDVSQYTSDRWACNTSTGLTTTVAISADAPVAAGLQYAIKNTGSVGLAIQQPVELQRTASNMMFYVGSQWTVSFWSTEDQTSNAVNVKFKNGTSDTGALPVSSTLPNFQSTGETADGYTRYSATFTVTQDASALATCNALAVIILVGAGQQITGCQLESGPVATPFELRPRALELSLCQRYYQVLSQIETFAVVSGTTTVAGQVGRTTTMRVAPTNTNGAGTSVTVAGNESSTEYWKVYGSSTASSAGVVVNLTSDAEL